MSMKVSSPAIRFEVNITELAFKLLSMIDVDQFIEQDKVNKQGDLQLVAEITAIQYAKTMQIDNVLLAAQYLNNAADQLLNAHIRVENNLTTVSGLTKLISGYAYCDNGANSLVHIRLNESAGSWLSFNKEWFYGQSLELASARFVKTTPIIKHLLDNSRE